MGIPIENGEMVSAREFARDYPRQFKRLQDKDVKKLVVTRDGEMEAVVLRVSDYEKLARKAA